MFIYFIEQSRIHEYENEFANRRYIDKLNKECFNDQHISTNSYIGTRYYDKRYHKVMFVPQRGDW